MNTFEIAIKDIGGNEIWTQEIQSDDSIGAVLATAVRLYEDMDNTVVGIRLVDAV